MTAQSDNGFNDQPQYLWVGEAPIPLSLLSTVPQLEGGSCFPTWKAFKTSLKRMQPPIMAFGLQPGIDILRSLCLPMPGIALCVLADQDIADDMCTLGVDMIIPAHLPKNLGSTIRVLRKRVMLEASLEEQVQVKHKALEGLAHDLRTPTTTIMAYTDLLHEDAPESCRDDLTHIAHNAGILEDLASRIIALTHEGETALGCHPKQISVEALFDKSIEAVRGAAKAKHIDIACQAEPDLPMLWIDPAAGQRIILNLLNNAVNASPPDSRITVSASLSGTFIRFCVSDEGPGIPVEQLNRVFMRPKAMKNTHGIGLAIVWELVTMHEGVVWVQNKASGGAEFTLTLPSADHSFVLYKSSQSEVAASPISNGVKITFQGTIDASAVTMVRSNVLAAVEEAQSITFDLAKCQDLPSGILALFVEISLECEKRASLLRVVSPPTHLADLMREINMPTFESEAQSQS